MTKAIIKHFRLKLNVYIKNFQCKDHLIHRKMLTKSFYFKNNMQVSEQKKIIVFGDLQISLDCLVSENVIRWMPQGIIDNKLTLVQVMAWCSQASTGLIVLSCCSDSGIVTHTTMLLLNSMDMFLAATKQLYDWFSPSVRPSVCLSVRHTFFTMFVSSWNFQELLPWSEVMSMQKVKVRGQRSRSQRSTPNLAVSGL